MGTRILRRVTSVTERRNPGFHKSRFVGGSFRYVLECGHEKTQKFSGGRRDKVACDACAQLSRGVVCTTVNGDGTELEERWDAATRMPVRRVIGGKAQQR